jgi:type II secretory pathway component PulK
MKGRGDRGIVLVAVLLMVAIMSVMVVAVTALTRSGIAGHGLEQRRLASHLALRSGIESAKALILATPAEERVYFDGTPQVLQLGDGVEAEVRIRDASGFADLNRTDLKLIDALLMSSLDRADAETISGRIAEWRQKAEKAEDKNTPGAPAPPGQQPGVQPPAGAGTAEGERTKPAPIIFQSTGQLLAMAESGDAAELEGVFTVFSPTGQVNPLAAAEDVLLSVPGLTPADISAVEAARKSRAPNALAGLGQMVERLKPYITLEQPSVFVIDVRLTAGPGIIAQSRAGAVAQVVDKGPLPFQTLWVSGS